MHRIQVKVFLLVPKLTIIFLLVSIGWGVCQERPIVMVTEQWPPFRITDETSPSGFRGIDIDITLKLSKALGTEIVIQRHPWARALELMKNGQADLITGVANTLEREQFMLYIPTSYYAVRPVFYTQKGKGHLIQTYEDLYDHKVGYSLKSAYFEPFNSDSKMNKIGFSTEEQLIRMLALKRISVTIGTDPNLSYDIARLGYRDVLEQTHYQPPVKTDLFFAISRKSSIVSYSKKIDKILKKLISDGVIDDIINSYM